MGRPTHDLRICFGEQGLRYPSDASVSGSQEYPVHCVVHRVSGWSVQGFLALAPGIDKNRASSLGARDRWHQTGLRGSALGSRARVLGYQFIPFLCFAGPERIIFVFKRRPLTTESGHRMAIRKHIHLTFPQSE